MQITEKLHIINNGQRVLYLETIEKYFGQNSLAIFSFIK